ncbi:MAG: helix-turn-helix domain-containing protein [Propionibacteriaceae bacterium]|nr:helix-turn-helix domain-containing protein [Propionibacteriaceae bacterium]
MTIKYSDEVERTLGRRRPLIAEEVADRLRTSVETLRYWRSIGKGPKSYKVGRRVLYDPDDLDLWLAQVKENGGAA